MLRIVPEILKTLSDRAWQIAEPDREAFCLQRCTKEHRAYPSENTPRPLNSNTSEQVEILDVFHPLDHRDAERAPLLTVPTGDAVLRPGAESLVMGPDGLWNLRLHHRKVVELVDHGDINALRTGGTVAAVGTLAGVGVAGSTGQNAGVVPLLLGGRLIGHRRHHVLRGVIARQDAGHCGAGQGVVDTLHRRQRHAEGRSALGKQPAAGVPLHHGDSNTPLLAELVKLGAVRVDAAQARFVVLRRKVVVHILAGGEQIEGGVDAEQKHLDLPAQGGQDAHLGVVGAQADVADDALCLLLLYIGQELSLHDPVELGLLIHEVDHAQVDVVGAQAGEQVLKGGLHFVHVPGADVLAVLPGGAEVSLDDPALPLPGDGGSDVGAHGGLRHPAVQDVDPLSLAAVDHPFDFLRAVALQPLRSQADLTDHQPRISQRPIFHE